jgi:hypothetical protein
MITKEEIQAKQVTSMRLTRARVKLLSSFPPLVIKQEEDSNTNVASFVEHHLLPSFATPIVKQEENKDNRIMTGISEEGNVIVSKYNMYRTRSINAFAK